MQRARSDDDKARRGGDLLAAAEAIAVESGGVRFVTVGEVTERVPQRQIGATINLIVEIRRSPNAKAGREISRIAHVRGFEHGQYLIA